VSNNADDALKLYKDLVNARYGDDEINLGGKTVADNYFPKWDISKVESLQDISNLGPRVINFFQHVE
jgi:hypothetical protein